VLLPYRNNVQEYWNALVNGVSSRPITYFDASKFKTQFACELKKNVLDFIDRKEARKMDRYAQYAMVHEETHKDTLITRQ
jgi:3-oxoacyl-[acyl-carrier-protein] synthase II